MDVMAEISLYPLRTPQLGHAIDGLVDELKAGGLPVRVGSMSSTVAGDVDAVLSGIGEAFKVVAQQGPVVLVVKVSNACPPNALPDANEAPGGS